MCRSIGPQDFHWFRYHFCCLLVFSFQFQMFYFDGIRYCFIGNSSKGFIKHVTIAVVIASGSCRIKTSRDRKQWALIASQQITGSQRKRVNCVGWKSHFMTFIKHYQTQHFEALMFTGLPPSVHEMSWLASKIKRPLLLYNINL